MTAVPERSPRVTFGLRRKTIVNGVAAGIGGEDKGAPEVSTSHSKRRRG